MSVQSKFYNLKQELSDRAMYNNQLVASVANSFDDEYQTPTIPDGRVTAHGYEIDYVTNPLTGDRQFYIGNVDGSNPDIDLDLNPIIIQGAEIGDHLDDVIQNTSLSINDLLTSVSSSGDLYAALASITTKFSYSNRVRLNDLYALIDQASAKAYSFGDYSIDTLKSQLLYVTNNDGYVTCQTWLVSLKNWFNNGNDTVENSSYELDHRNPLSLDGIISAVINGLVDITTSILILLKSIFTKILGFVIKLISSLFSILAKYFDNGCDVDSECPNLFIKGPILAAEIPLNLSLDAHSVHFFTGDEFNDSSLKQYRIRFVEKDGIATYYWFNDDYTKMKANAYLYPCYTPSEVAFWINELIVSHDIIVTKLYKTSAFNMDTYIYHTCSYISSSPTINDDRHYDELFADGKNVFYSICVDTFVRCLKSVNHAEKLAALSTYVGSTIPNTRAGLTSTCEISSNTGDPKQIYAQKLLEVATYGARIVGNVRSGDSVDKDITWASLQTSVINLIKDVYKYGSDIDLALNFQTTPNGYIDNGGYITGCDFINSSTNWSPERVYNLTPTSIIISGTRQSLDETPRFVLKTDSELFERPWFTFDDETVNDLMILADVLPACWGITLNAITLNQVINGLVLLASIATATAVVSATVGRALRIKKQNKLVARTATLAAKYQDVQADPTNTTLVASYTKEVRKFNLLGRMLGWGSFDAQNGWFNAPETSTNIVDSTSNIISSTLNSASAKEVIDDIKNNGFTYTDTHGVSHTVNLKQLEDDVIDSNDNNTEVIIAKLDYIIRLIGGDTSTE